MQKGQTTVEFIVILTIALLVLAVVAVTYINQAETAQALEQQSYSDYWQSADIAIIAHKFEENQATLRLQNNVPYNITITKITVAPYSNITNITLAPGQKETVVTQFQRSVSLEGQLVQTDVAFTYSTSQGKVITFTGQAPLQGQIS